jgi:hypothetical protein
MVSRSSAKAMIKVHRVVPRPARTQKVVRSVREEHPQLEEHQQRESTNVTKSIAAKKAGTLLLASVRVRGARIAILRVRSGTGSTACVLSQDRNIHVSSKPNHNVRRNIAANTAGTLLIAGVGVRGARTASLNATTGTGNTADAIQNALSVIVINRDLQVASSGTKLNANARTRPREVFQRSLLIARYGTM